MTKDEFKPLAAALKTAYPKDNFLSTSEALNLWFMMLSDLPAGSVKDAVSKYILTSRYVPTIADLRALAVQENKLDGSEAFGMALKAVQRFGIYQKDKALESLPDDVARTLDIFGYESLCNTNYEDLGVARAQFRKTYEGVQQRDKETLMLPEKLRGVKLLG